MNTYKFLIIEDDSATRELLGMLLKKNFECQISEAENGKVALELLENFSPDLIFLDLSMPVLDGKETLKKIRSKLLMKRIPVIILTAHGDKNTVKELIENGVSEYILKPIEFGITIQRVKNVLEKSKAIQDQKTKKFSPETHQILVVTKNKLYTHFVKEALKEDFLVYSANSGSEGFDLFNTHLPGCIILCDEQSVLDKKIMTQKIRDISGGNRILVFLLIDSDKPLTSSVFNYDGIIKRTFEKEILLNELYKLLTVDFSPMEKLQEEIDKMIPGIQAKFKKVFFELFGYEINSVEQSDLDKPDTILNITFSINTSDNLKLLYSIFSTEKNIVSVAAKTGHKSGKDHIAASEMFLKFAEIFSEELIKELHLNRISAVKESQSEIVHEHELPVGEWNSEICFQTKDAESFCHRISILKDHKVEKTSKV